MEWSLAKWLLPVKASFRRAKLTQEHFTSTKLLHLLQFCFLELMEEAEKALLTRVRKKQILQDEWSEPRQSVEERTVLQAT